MKNLIIGLVLVGLVSCAKPVPPVLTVASGSIVRYENFPSVSISPRNIDVWLPEGYTPNKKYSVLYMHDGQMLFDSTINWNKLEWGADETFTALINNQTIPPCIIVGIWNTSTRHPDYFPQKPFEQLEKDFQDSLIQEVKRGDYPLFSTSVQSDNYLKFIVEELKPKIDQEYSTYSDADHTYIAGSSMGGLISMYAICEYPEVFGGAACLSTHWTGIFVAENNPIPWAFRDYLRDHLPDPANHKIYFDYGTETLDSLYEPFQLMIDTVMVNGGYESNNWKTLKFPGENHTEIAWAKRLKIPISFLMGQE